MVKQNAISKVLNVWESGNKINNPVKKELFLDIIEQMANLFAAGSYFYFIVDFENLELNMLNDSVESILGIAPGIYPLDKMLEIVHPEDIEKMHEKESAAIDFILNKIPKEQITYYKVVYLIRLKHKDGTYKTILHQSKPLVMSQDGKVQKTLAIYTDVTYLNMPIDHKISFVSNKFPSYHSLQIGESLNANSKSSLDTMTEREKEIIELLSHGKNFNQMAKILNVSPHTVNTHKRNILKKTKCNNTTELVARCIREGAI